MTAGAAAVNDPNSKFLHIITAESSQWTQRARCKISWLAGGRERALARARRRFSGVARAFRRAPEWAVRGQDPLAANFATRSEDTENKWVFLCVLRVLRVDSVPRIDQNASKEIVVSNSDAL